MPPVMIHITEEQRDRIDNVRHPTVSRNAWVREAVAEKLARSTPKGTFRAVHHIDGTGNNYPDNLTVVNIEENR